MKSIMCWSMSIIYYHFILFYFITILVWVLFDLLFIWLTLLFETSHFSRWLNISQPFRDHGEAIESLTCGKRRSGYPFNLQKSHGDKAIKSVFIYSICLNYNHKMHVRCIHWSEHYKCVFLRLFVYTVMYRVGLYK